MHPPPIDHRGEPRLAPVPGGAAPQGGPVEQVRHGVGPLRGSPAGDGLALGGGGPGPAPGGPAQSGGVAPKDVARVAVVRRQGAVHVPDGENLNSNKNMLLVFKGKQDCMFNFN